LRAAPVIPQPQPDVTVWSGHYVDGPAWATAIRHEDGRRVQTADVTAATTERAEAMVRATVTGGGR